MGSGDRVESNPHKRILEVIIRRRGAKERGNSVWPGGACTRVSAKTPQIVNLKA